MSSSSTETGFGRPINRLDVFANLSSQNSDASKKCMSLFSDTDSFVRQIKVPKVSDLTFVVDGVPFHAHNTPRGVVADLTIWCVLGYLPYTVTSQEKREKLLTILEATRSIPSVKFGVDRQTRIIASAVFEIPNPPTPTYVFEPLIKFLQYARPFMNLIGEFL